MGKKLLCFLITLTLLVGAIPLVGAADTITGTVHGINAGSNLNVRANPSTTAAIVTRLVNGDLVTILSEKTAEGIHWYQIQHEAVTGWASAEFIRKTPSYNNDQEFESYLTEQKFPESYKAKLRQIHAAHPQWVFVAEHLPVTWNDAYTEQTKPKKNAIQTPEAWKSMAKGCYDWTNKSYVAVDSGGWVTPVKDVVAYYMDPRNFLDTIHIFQFESLTYSATHTETGVKAILPSALDKHAADLLTAAREAQVSAYFLATRMTQEGSHNNGLGTGTVKGYEGYYNFFHIGAYAHSGNGAVTNGAIYAKEKGWNTPYKCLLASAKDIGSSYINKGQNTLYFQKFDVTDGGNGFYNHQYMTNIEAAYYEGRIRGNQVTAAEKDSPLTFLIPVYKSMRTSATTLPGRTGNNNYFLDSLTVSGATLSPAFERYTGEYTATVAGGNSVTLSVKKSDSGATVTGTGKKTLVPGDNVFPIKVTSTSGRTKTYTVTVKNLALVTSQPQDVCVYNGESVYISVGTYGTGLTYQWYFKNKGGSSFLKTDTFTGNSYTTKMDATRDGRQVYCVVTNREGKSAQTNTVTMRTHSFSNKCDTTCNTCDEVRKVGDHVYDGAADKTCNECGHVRKLVATILTQPQSASAQMGQSVQVKVSAAGDGLTYQWYVKNKGASAFTKSSLKTSTYTTTLSDASRNRQVYCVVKDTYGNSVKSATATLHLAATITAESATNCFAKPNATTKASVTAIGDGLTYQWYVKNPGASAFVKSSLTAAVYTAKVTEQNNGRQIYCVVTDKYNNQAQSKTFVMRIQATVVTQPQSTPVPMEETAQATVEAIGDDLTYQWYIKNKGAIKFSKSSLTVPTYTVKMSTASNGRQVYCVIKDKYGNTAQSDTITLRAAATITAQPAADCFAKQNATAKATITAVGDGLTYQWHVKNVGSTKFVKSSLTASTYSVKMTAATNGRQVYCVIKDKYGNTAQSNIITLRIQATIVTQPKAVTVTNGNTATTTVTAVGDDLTYQWYIKNKGTTKFVKSSLTVPTYTVKMSTAANGRQVYCVVTDKYGNTVQSNTVTLKKK